MLRILAHFLEPVAPGSARTVRGCGVHRSLVLPSRLLRGESPAVPPVSRRPRARPRPPPRQPDLPLEIPPPPQLIPLAEAQRWLGVSPETFARLLCTGQLPVVHVGRRARIEDTVLLAWLAAQGRVPAHGEA